MDLFQSVFVIIIVIFVATILYHVIEYFRNESTPEVAVQATLVDKSMESGGHTDANGVSHSNISYHLLFELENGERLAFNVSFSKYKPLVIGDSGILRYQRKRFNSLDRQN